MVLPVNAQVSLKPLVEVSNTRNGQASGIVTVRNNTDEEFRARVYSSPFTYDRDSGFQDVKESPSDLTPYLVYAPRELVVPANTERRVRYIVRFPPNHSTGEFRAMLFTETLQELPSDSNAAYTVKVKNRIGTALYIRSGNLTPDLIVESISYNSQSDELKLLLKNTGSATARPSVDWELKQGNTKIRSGSVGSTTTIAKGERYLLLSGDKSETNSTEQTVSAPISSGTYKLTGKIQWENLDKEESMPFELELVVP